MTGNVEVVVEERRGGDGVLKGCGMVVVRWRDSAVRGDGAGV